MRISINNDIKCIDKVYNKVKRDFNFCSLPVVNDVNLILDEILSNIIKYSGNKQKIDIGIEKFNDFIEITVNYSGVYFNINKYKEKIVSDEGNGDIGVILIKKFSSKIIYKHRKRHSTLIVYLPLHDMV